MESLGKLEVLKVPEQTLMCRRIRDKNGHLRPRRPVEMGVFPKEDEPTGFEVKWFLEQCKIHNTGKPGRLFNV